MATTRTKTTDKDTEDTEPVVSTDAEDPRFSRERVLSPAEGPLIAGHPYPVLVGALFGDDSPDFTRSEIQQKVAEFLGRTPHEEA